ncbi:MAG TPA: hypothetical protein VE860_01340 [Chthoniobacterales bacterium]|jgi:ABC-type transporter Mla subunit MlaD|nr:hypothetical protein [Chthoniobacterales bacterium]
MDGKVDWNQLVDALRDELQEKGGLIRLLDQQVQAVYRRDTRENERLEEQIRLQLRVIARSTQFRELILRQSASSFQMSEDVHVNELIANFPDFVRPLLEALVTEVDRLSNRLQERLGQNEGLKQRFLIESTSGA